MRFFNSILIQYTKGTYLSYNKRRLNEVYLHDKMKKTILKVMENIKFIMLLSDGKRLSSPAFLLWRLKNRSNIYQQITKE